MTRQERRMLRQAMEELKIQLIDQGCQTLREAATRDHVTFVRLVQVAEHLGYTFSQEVRWMAGLSESVGRPQSREYHRDTLKDKTINTSITLNKRGETWWVTLTYDVPKPAPPPVLTPVVDIDVGIANFVTTSTGEYYGSFDQKLRQRHKRDRAKRKRKAKLRACLEKKGVQKLPSTSSRTGQRLARHVRQSINRAVNEYFTKHPDAPVAYEHVSVATMRFKARAMNAYLYASNLAHIPQQIAWGALKRGIPATQVKSAYSSQECHVCYYTDKKNRPNQQTFCCKVCSQSTNADLNAAQNIAWRLGDEELKACTHRNEIKALLMRRHEATKHLYGLVVVQPAADSVDGQPGVA